MTKARAGTPQQRAARELARTPPANPYRGALTDPFSRPEPEPADEGQPDAEQRTTAGQRPSADQPTADRPTATGRAPYRTGPPGYAASARTPGYATFAGILGIALGLTLGLFGLLLLTIVSLQNDYGAPDRSFYRGTDSGYVVLGLLDFGLAVCCGIGGIVLMTGRVSGRIAVTAGGWTTVLLSGFWLLDGNVQPVVPIVLAVAAATMLFFSYQQQVTYWLGVLPPPHPE
ncbi:MAG TPA: hypothetical protein VFU36_09765 [Jatrophihabitans sp.]|nr:hypothetical protein [Jatrophihabitans sp.]